MPLADFLAPSCVLTSPTVEDKWDLLNQMADRLGASGAFSTDQLETVNKALFAREQSVSTGMEDGIAVPHAALDCISTVHAGLALIPDGIDFQALDGKPSQIVVMLLVPRAEKLLHVRTLTEIARRLSDPTFREKLLASGGGEETREYWK